MKTSTRGAISFLILFVVSTAANFGVFIFNYRTLAFPYLTEEQRVANADRILTVGLSTFALAALLTASIAYIIILLNFRDRCRAR